MNMKRLICMLISATMLFLAAGSASGETAEPGYYHIGLKVTELMGEITDSEDYLSMLTLPESFSQVREKINTHDYNRPVAVYSVSMSDPKAFLEEMMFRNDPETLEAWNRLSPALQDQLLGRIGVQTLISIINARAGTEYIAFFSVATAFVRDELLTAEGSRCYLYFFEKGVPILVSFGYHAASGQFFFIPEEARENAETILAYLQLPFLEITPVKTAESAVSGTSANPADYGIDMEEALEKMNRAIGEQIPVIGGMVFSDSVQPKFELFDVTGDGCADLFTCVTWGSGMVRTDLVVYDALEEALYVLDGYSYDYLIDHVEEDRIVIVKEGPHGYGDPITKTYGTVKLENRQLVFTADSEEQE